MSTQTIVPVFDPSGTLRDVPFEHLQDAIKGGGKPAIKFSAPDGKTRYVPADQTADAVKAGGKIMPIEDQDVKHPGFWSTLGDDLSGMAKGAVPHSLEDAAAMVVPGVGGIQQGQQLAEDDAARAAEGRSKTYRTIAPIAQVLTGVNARGMEQSANEGDIGGVLGHAAAPLAVLAATEGVSKGAPAVADTAAARAAIEKINKLTPKQAGQVIGGAGGAGLGHGTLSAPGAYYGAKTGGKIVEGLLGKERANAPFTGKPKVETPPPPIPAKAMHQAIQELGTKAPVADITARAANIAKLGDLLNDALGGKGLEPNVALKDQGKVITPKENVPAGHTPVESSVLKSYSYDPETQEFESVTNTGSHYVHGEVTPEQVADFEAADSKGKAWNELRKTATPVAKVINGKRVPIRPVVSEEDAISPDEWEAGHELETEVEGTPR